MVKKKGNRALFTSIAILIVLLAGIAAVVIIKAVTNGQADTTQTTSSDSTQNTDISPPPATTDEGTSTTDTDTNPDTEPAIDPATVSTIDIAPMELTVSYIKGIGGFEFNVLRTSSGTRYVQFSSPTLVGTKCSNDEGMFATILQDPSTDESATITKKTTVDGTEYGLSLTGSTCTNDAELLAKYQQSFSDAFTLLKKME